jgi:hypothetical protein
MGPEAMGFNPPNLDWWNEKVCRDYLFGTCLHDTFSNTVSWPGPYEADIRKWTSGRVQRPTRTAS